MKHCEGSKGRSLKYNSATNIKSARPSPKISEAEATKRLTHHFYFGVGEKYLGWRFPEYNAKTGEVVRDGHLEKWSWPEPECRRHGSPFVVRRPNLLFDHLKGSYRGLVTGCGETHVPCLAADIDRHPKGKKTPTIVEHCEIVEQTFRIALLVLPEYKISVESNPDNGSGKLFFWPKRGQFIPIERAKTDAAQLRAALIAAGITTVCVFPDNLPNLRLPLHPSKINLVGSGLIRRMERKKKSNGRFWKFTTHSAAQFAEWLFHDSRSADLRKTLLLVRHHSENMPDPIEVQPTESGTHSRSATNAAVVGEPTTADMCGSATQVVRSRDLDTIRGNPDAWQRNLRFTLYFARNLRRVPTVQEMLAADRGNGIHHGSWEDGLPERTRRYQNILPFVAQTFDSAKCGRKSERPQLEERIRFWRGQAYCLTDTIRSTIHRNRTMGESGEAVEFGVGRTFIVERPHVLYLAAILQHLVERHADRSICRESIEGWWTELAEEGLLPKWNKDYYLACRKVLERKGWVKIDNTYHPGRAKRAEITYWSEPVGIVYVRYCDLTEKHTHNPYKGCGVFNSPERVPSTAKPLEDRPKPPP
jgi:hypothetical protein